MDLVNQEDPNRTVQTFIDLIQRHEQAFYTFVHRVHSKGEGLFDSLMSWIERFLTVVRDGLGDPISLEFLLPHTGQERSDILQEVDAVAVYHYKLKVAYEDKIRRRFGRLQGQTDADAEDEATQVLLQNVAGEINFGDLVRGDAIDLAAEDSDESECESSSEDETDSDDESESSEQSVVTSPPRMAERPPSTVKSPVNQSSNTGPVTRTSRPRSLSLKLSRSLTSLRQATHSSRRSHDIPSVPPIPKVLNRSTTTEKALPLPPTKPPQAAKGPKQRTPETLKPPQLHHLPKLLPIFVELVSDRN